jgi:hypothetical protein
MLIKTVRPWNKCREEARKNMKILSNEISKKGEISWTRVLEVADHDEQVNFKISVKKGTILVITKSQGLKANESIFLGKYLLIQIQCCPMPHCWVLSFGNLGQC